MVKLQLHFGISAQDISRRQKARLSEYNEAFHLKSKPKFSPLRQPMTLQSVLLKCRKVLCPKVAGQPSDFAKRRETQKDFFLFKSANLISVCRLFGLSAWSARRDSDLRPKLSKPQTFPRPIVGVYPAGRGRFDFFFVCAPNSFSRVLSNNLKAVFASVSF
ncbi:MAG: hypothetical protein WKF73_16620 [Nocardioidaceae bacterium]